MSSGERVKVKGQKLGNVTSSLVLNTLESMFHQNQRFCQALLHDNFMI